MGGAPGVTPDWARPAIPAPAAAARTRRGGARTRLLPPGVLPLTSMHRLGPRFPPGRPPMAPPPSRSPHWLFHHPRAAAEERTGSGTPIGCDPHSRQPAPRPGPRDVTGWRGATLRRLVLIGCLAPLTSRTAHPPPRSGLPPPTLFFIREGGGRSGLRLERKRPMEAPREGRGGGLCGRTGESSANGRAPHIPASGAPPLATHVLAGRAQGHARLAAHRAGRAPARMVEGLRRGRRGSPRAGGYCGVLGHCLREARPPSGGAGSGP